MGHGQTEIIGIKDYFDGRKEDDAEKGREMDEYLRHVSRHSHKKTAYRGIAQSLRGVGRRWD